MFGPVQYWYGGKCLATVYLNGEIYNYWELATELGCHRGSESEVLACGFATEGPDFVKKLNGMFFIVAEVKGQIYMFRDRYGSKPAYYFNDSKRSVVIVASGIKPILTYMRAFSIPVEIDAQAEMLWKGIQNNVGHTLFNGIRLINKGTKVTFYEEGYGNITHMSEAAFWNWKIAPVTMDYKVAVEETKRLVTRAVGKMLPNEKFGICLSGGIDSGIIAAITKDVRTYQHTFTCRYSGEDEGPLAELSAGANHYEIFYRDLVPEHFEKTIFHLEDLRAGASWSNYGLYELMSKYVRVGLDGAGADELFGGYVWRYNMKVPFSQIINRSELLKDQHMVNWDEDLHARWRYDMNMFLQGVLLTVDRLSMAHTLEMRTPFLDNDLVDFALNIPDEFRYGKMLLKDAFRDVLPPAVIQGPKKGWSSPDWLYGPGNKADRWTSTALMVWKKIFLNERI
ncbi:MAG: hypothetical protein JNM00_15850 [Flavobacteriales bacterium]|nr:hypothetical protein [Flavobacteriales bacterium]